MESWSQNLVEGAARARPHSSAFLLSTLKIEWSDFMHELISYKTPQSFSFTSVTCGLHEYFIAIWRVVSLAYVHWQRERGLRAPLGIHQGLPQEQGSMIRVRCPLRRRLTIQTCIGINRRCNAFESFRTGHKTLGNFS